MSFRLKIAAGPNKGAEIALVEGVAVTFGKTDDCDIMLADATFPDSPVRLEATPTGVTVDGAALANFHVRTIGSTAFAVGPADAPWGDLTWPAREERQEGAAEGREAPTPPSDRPATESPNGATDESPASSTRRHGCLGCLVVFILLAILLAVLGWFFRDQARPYAEKVWRMASATTEESGSGSAGTAETSGVCTNETLPQLVARYVLAETNRNGNTVYVGNFATRAERLSATARIYAAQPGVELDLSDGETLKTAVADMLALVGERTLSVVAVTNRTAVLVGRTANLRRTLEAISADVPKLVNVDVAGVKIVRVDPEPPRASLPRTSSPEVLTVADVDSDNDDSGDEDPEKPVAPPRVDLPVCGILTTPYPCLVLRDGARIMEGASIGDNVVLKIAADSVTLTNATGRFVWKP